MASSTQLRTNRSVVKYILLSVITFGIYGLICMMNVSKDINTVASEHDGKKTMNYLLMCIICPFTLGILSFVWYHKFSNRLKEESIRRGLPCNFSAKTFWGWNVLGVLLCGVGPIVYFYKLFKTMNAINEDYNNRG